MATNFICERDFNWVDVHLIGMKYCMGYFDFDIENIPIEFLFKDFWIEYNA